MFISLTKRVIAWLLSVLMSFASAPIQEVFPDIDNDFGKKVESVIDIEESGAIWNALLEINSVLLRYFGANDISEDEIASAVSKMSESTISSAKEDIQKITALIKKLTREERKNVSNTDSGKSVGFFASLLGMDTGINALSLEAPQGTNSVLGGKVTVTDSEGTGSVSNNVVTITVKGGLVSGKTNTIDIYNNTNAISTLSFNYSASNYESFSLGTANGTYSVVLNPGAGITITLGAGAFYKEAKLVMSNINLVEAASSSNVTFEYNSAYGSVTVNGASVAAGESRKITLADGATLAATASNSGRFLGWINTANSQLISTDASFKLTPVADMTVRAVFVGSTGVAYFRANGGSFLFDDLNKAAAYASSSGYNTIILMNDGTLPAGNYTIPSGVTLLIPFDDANTIYTTEPAIVSDAYTKPTAYRTLTMAEGANITVNGALCLPAKHYSAHGSHANGASPTGTCPFIKMSSGSNITVNNGGNLYAYGYITGSGTVTAKNGANVYEYFQIMDFRGGTQTTDMENGVFPLSQYYIQNIEVPLILEYGAVENCYASVFISKMEMGTSVAFIAPNGGMFNLSSGSLTKRYDGKTDRLIFELNGIMSISPIELEFGSGLLGASINSQNYELPINNNITVKVNSGSVTLSQDVAMLPGCELIIAENAKCILGSNCNVYVYDADQWGNFCGATNKTFIPVGYAPGRTYTRKASDIKDTRIQVAGTLDASNGYLYTTSGGADICGVESGKILLKKGSQTKTYQLVQKTGYTEIPITPAKLKNADGTYVTPAASSSTNYYVNGVWCEHSGHVYTETVTAQATCDTAGLKTFTCFCGSSYTEAIPAKGHTQGAAATCTAAQICTTCGKILAAELGHSYNSVTTEPTCTEGGYTTHTCARCGDVYTDGIVAANGHVSSGNATCTTDSVCTVCGSVLEAAKGHDYNAVVTAPTCTKSGYTTHTCLRCGDSYIDNEIDALGHTAGADATCTAPQTCTVCGEILKSENGHVAGVEATCTEAQICTVCGAELTPALGHDMIHSNATDATCTEDGYSSGSHCSRCDHTEGKAVIPAKGHTPGASATCTSNQICTVCGVELKPATGHNYQASVTAPTCTGIGYTTHTCLNCGDSYTDGEVPAKGHTKGTAATCSAAQTCVDCGTELAPKLGHIPGAEATCTKSQLCLDCGEILVLAKGHTVGPEATCTSAQLCTVCSEELASAKGHNYSETVTAPTCTESGYTTHTCLNCGDSYFDGEVEAIGHDMMPATCRTPSMCCNSSCTYTEGEALGHTVVISEEIPATCEQDGITEGKHCLVCHAVIAEQVVIPAMGHNIVKHDAKNPTYTEIGWEAYEECLRCDYTTYKEIPRLEEASISDYETFVINLARLEELAQSYAMEVPGKDPLDLVIKYIRTGVEKYNEGSWGIMAGYEDKGFAEFVSKFEDEYNSVVGSGDLIIVSGLKNLENFVLPNGDLVDFGHMFGSMDITYHNNYNVNHADVSGWTGDLVDLLEFSDYGGVTGALDEMIEDVGTNYLLQEDPEEIGGFNQQDMYGDLDSFCLMRALSTMTYNNGVLAELFVSYFTEELTMETRADYFIKNRLDGVSTRANMREAVYNIYTSNKLITTLESTREFKTENITELRRACCYAFADYICELAGDFVEVTDNPYFTAFHSETSTLAPGVIQNIKMATSADNKQMVYYTATADLSRDDVQVYANYKDNDPTTWGMQTVLGQANAAQNKYGNPESELYIENYNVIASINGGGYNMSTGEPGGLLIMDGKEYQGIGASGFFGILKDGTAVIGTTAEYNNIYRGQLKEAIGGFGTTLIKNGEIAITATSDYYTDRASRTAVGITKTGKVVFMVLDGRQEPISCGGSMIEIAHIMYEAGCVQAINLDGGGSTTYVAKVAGADELSVVSKPSDGASRSVSTSLIMVSTAPSSTAFDHALIESEYDYLTKDSSVQLTASGVSATGNAAELPEGTVWSVSDENCATITQDGVLTALRNGSVDVYLMSGDEIIGSKTMNIVVPQRVYFSKTNINAIYDKKTELPIVALYENKPVAINESDVSFTLNNTAAGIFEGFNLIAVEGSGVKNVTVTAALTADTERTATIVVALYYEDEISFDFDAAVGGNRLLAWNREVSNSTTEDNIVYDIVDPEQPMVTTYTFAIDMTQIPIPEQLKDLTSMLPGAELEGASAWTFLLQLAERVSVLTEVKPVIYFDKNFDVDCSELSLINDYFELNGKEYDPETNSLTLILNWKDQTQAIDPTMANPLCILSGIKAVPKADAEWTKDKLNPVNTGEVSYKMYMRANALYSFAQKPENQVAYGIYPFVNPNNANEKGGYLESVYATLEDTYTLSIAIKEGWVNEEGGFAYYIDGNKLTGVQFIDGYYYDFGDDGINVGQTKFTGLFYDEIDSVYRYSKFGELASGWQMIGEDWYYFHSSTLAAKSGYYRVGDVYYDFEETGKIVTGVWVKTLEGTRYYYGPSCYFRGWYEIDGKNYYFRGNYRYEGLKAVVASAMPTIWYDFGPDGACRGELNGIYFIDGNYCYIENGIATEKHLFKYGNDYYYATYKGILATNKTLKTASTNCDLPNGTYTFDSEGKMVGSSANGSIVELDGVLYYYENGVGVEKGLVKVGNDYYYAAYKGKLAVSKVITAPLTSCDLPAKAKYEFGADGKMLNGIIEKDGVLYYYENGKGVEKGLIKFNGDYYYTTYNGKVAVSKSVKAAITNCDLPKGVTYEFGADGKMLSGIIEKDGVLYYYENGQGVEKGLISYNGAYYYAAYKGQLVVGKEIKATITSCDLPVDRYEFGTDGKMLSGIIEKDGVLYYYENGKGAEKGLIKYNGDYFYTVYGGRIVVNTSVKAAATNCDLPKGVTYEFGADGKMLSGIIEKDGVLYYYENGQGVEKGLICYNANYYYAAYKGQLVVGKEIKATISNCDLPIGVRYEFDTDGKMLSGIIEKDGVLYYYENGQGVEKGLISYNGNYYYAAYKGQLVVGKEIKVTISNCDLPAGVRYEFGADGKMLDGIVEKDGVLYYYENGKGIEKGIVEIDGHYYYATYKGKLAVNTTIRITATNNLLVAGTYTFNEYGQIIG